MADFFSTKDSKLVLPTEYAQTVFAKARETSVVGRLATASPLTLGGTTLPIYNGEVNMGVVAEGARKPGRPRKADIAISAALGRREASHRWRARAAVALHRRLPDHDRGRVLGVHRGLRRVRADDAVPADRPVAGRAARMVP